MTSWRAVDFHPEIEIEVEIEVEVEIEIGIDTNTNTDTESVWLRSFPTKTSNLLSIYEIKK